MNKNIVIITGGCIEDTFACDFLNRIEDKYIIAADKGIEFLKRQGIKPDEILGDFDSADELLVEQYRKENIPFTTFPCEKDYTDTKLAIDRAVELLKGQVEVLDDEDNLTTENIILDFRSWDKVYILGALGGRMDHFLGNVYSLIEAFDRQVSVILIDSLNKIYLTGRESSIKKEEQFGEYVSFIPIMGDMKLSLTGFKYNLNDYCLHPSNVITVCNEIIENEAFIRYDRNYLLALETKDRKFVTKV